MSLARLRALILLSVFGILASVAVMWAIAHDSQNGPQEQATCPARKVLNTKIPKPNEVLLVVLNGTDRDGLANHVRKQLAARGFTQVSAGNAMDSIDSPAQVRYGPAAAGAAQLVRAHIAGAEAQPNRELESRVELILGPKYKSLTPSAEVSAALRQLGKPSLPTPICSKTEQ